MIAIPARARRALLYVGYPAFAVAVAVLTLYATLPRDRIKDRLEQMFAADPTSGQPLAIGMDTTIEDVSLTLFSGLGIKGTNLLLRTKPVNPGDKAVRFSVDDATVHVGLWGLVFGRPSYTYKGHAFKGAVTGGVSLTPDDTSLEIVAGGIDLASLPQGQVGLPLEGTLSINLKADAPKNLIANTNGSFELGFEDASVGDGKAKLTVPGDPFLSQGLTFPRIRLGKMAGTVAIEKGRAKLDGFVIHSPDVDLTLEGFIELRDPIGMSQMHGYLKFKPSEALLKREATIELMSNTLGAIAKRADGYLGFQLTGPLSAVFFMPSKDPPPGVMSRPLATGTVSAAPTGGTAPTTTVLPPPIAPPRPAMLPPPPSPEPEREREREEPPAPPPPPPSVPPATTTSAPAATRALVNRAVEELSATQTHHGEDPPPPPPPPEGAPAKQE